MEFITSTSSQLAPVLRRIRKAAGKTQVDVAASVGLLAKTVSTLESDPGRCRVDSLLKILSALDLEMVLRAKPGPVEPSNTSNSW